MPYLYLGRINGKNSEREFYTVTPELLAQAEKKVLLPGDFFSFEDTVDCEKVILYEEQIRGLNLNQSRRSNVRQPRRSNTRSGGGLRPINQHAQSFMTVKYGLESVLNPKGACLKSGVSSENIRLDVIEDEKPVCQKQGNQCGNGKQQGTCHFPFIEPKRKLGHLANVSTQTSKEVDTVVIVRFVPPH